MATALMAFPEATNLPKPIFEAYQLAVEEIKTLIRSPAVQQRFASVLLSELRTQRALQQCTPESIVLAVVEMAQMGLDPVASNECYLIPYTVYDHGRVQRVEAQMQLGYAGLTKLATAHPDVLDLWTDLVRERDEWEYQGLNARPHHVYPKGFAERGKVIGFYSVALLSRDRVRCLARSVAEMQAHAKRFSRNHDKKVWSDGPGGGFEGMGLKTMLRLLCNPKVIPMAGRVAELVERGNPYHDAIVLDESAWRLHETEIKKSMQEHMLDLGYEAGPNPPPPDEPDDVPEPDVPVPEEEEELAPVGATARLTAPTPGLSEAIDGLLAAHGFTAQQKLQWRTRQCKRFRVKAWEALSPELLEALLDELKQLPLASEPEGEPSWRTTLRETADRTADLVGALPEGEQRLLALELCAQARHASTQASTTMAQAQDMHSKLYQASDDAAQALGLSV